MILLIVIKDKDILNLNKEMRVRAIFFTPLFLITYIPCALQALTKRNIQWEKMEHNRSLDQK